MGTQEWGNRIETMKGAILELADAYYPASSRGEGITGINFFNKGNAGRKVLPGAVGAVMKSTSYSGLSTMGNQLCQVLQEFAPNGNEMTKPLIVLIITDGEVCFQLFDS